MRSKCVVSVTGCLVTKTLIAKRMPCMPRKPSVPTCLSVAQAVMPRCEGSFAVERGLAGLALRTRHQACAPLSWARKGTHGHVSCRGPGQGRCGAERRLAPLYCTNANAVAPRCLRAASGGATAVRRSASSHAAQLQGFGECGKMPHYDCSTVAFCYTIPSTAGATRRSKPYLDLAETSWGLYGRRPKRAQLLSNGRRTLERLVLMLGACQQCDARWARGMPWPRGPYRLPPGSVNICTGASKLDPNTHVRPTPTFSAIVQRWFRALAYPQGSGPGLRPGPSAAVFGAFHVLCMAVRPPARAFGPVLKV